jgi:hypothetical protein
MGGSLTADEVIPYVTKYPELETFIETGTYKGYTTRMAATQFENVYTFELSPELHQESVQAAKNHNFDTSGYLLGDSTQLLRDVLTAHPDPTFFFLDAHMSGPDSTYNGVEHVPVITELKLINELYPRGMKGVICVDDHRLFSKFWDWAHVSLDSIKEIFINHTITHEVVENDRYWLTIN